MEWLVENWFVGIGLLALVISVGFIVVKFLGIPTKEQIKKIKAWLLQAVVLAEKELGSGTGKIKLSSVYDMFVSKFPMTAKFVSFETFSLWVDYALDEMKEMLKTNENVARLVEK